MEILLGILLLGALFLAARENTSLLLALPAALLLLLPIALSWVDNSFAGIAFLMALAVVLFMHLARQSRADTL